MAAITSPTPSTAASSSTDFDTIASSVWNSFVNASDAAGPRWRTPSAVSSFGSGRVFDFGDLVDQVLGAGRADPIELDELVDRQRVQVGRVPNEPGGRELLDHLLAEALDVHRAA